MPAASSDKEISLPGWNEINATSFLILSEFLIPSKAMTSRKR